jgi:hypothetical protein
MSGPFRTLEALDLPGFDDSLACVDGVCAVPGSGVPTGSAEGVVEELSLGVAEGDLPDSREG